MTALAPTLEAFFTERLARQRRASGHTVAAYRDTWRLLLARAASRAGKPPSRLDFTDLDAPAVAAFLDHLENDRGNSIRTRNARLAAIHSAFSYAALRHPEHAALIARVLAIPAKRADRALVTWLTEEETAALLAAPDPATRTGRRDHAMLHLAVVTGLRVSELTALTTGSIHLGTGPHVTCQGKGRKQRVTPLTAAAVTILREWLRELPASQAQVLFPGRAGSPLSRDAVERRLSLHAVTAATSCPSLAGKKISPHVLRHTAAMRLLHAGVEVSDIALWLGHEQTETAGIYLHADLALKEKALARTTPPDASPGRYRPPDPLLAFLESL
jgi:site-specific recombinase XerD